MATSDCPHPYQDATGADAACYDCLQARIVELEAELQRADRVTARVEERSGRDLESLARDLVAARAELAAEREALERKTECPHFMNAKVVVSVPFGDLCVGLCRDCLDVVRESIGLIECDERHEASVIAEREACAKLADVAQGELYGSDAEARRHQRHGLGTAIAAAIRARGKEKP